MPQVDSYVLEQSGEELDRLLMVSELLRPTVEETCRRAGLSAGGRAVDVGCGPLGALPALARIVGARGTVVGVDADARALETARRALDRGGIAGVRLVHADANDLSPGILGEGGLDLAFCRLVLMHQSDPAGTMARIARVLRPGGTLVAMDFFGRPACEPSHPAVDRAWDIVIDAMRARGASPSTSRRYTELCARAGLEVVSQRGLFFPMPPAAIVSEAAVLLRGARTTIESHAIASASEVDALLGALRVEDLPADSVGFSPQTVELVARKPVAAAGERS